jgi:NitT/TauT family transport system ATP-binding protein
MALLQRAGISGRSLRVPPRGLDDAPGAIAVERDPAFVTITGVNKTFGVGPQAKKVCSDISLEIASGSFTSIVGPSGCGKSTLLNMCAGLIRPDNDNGKIVVGGREINGPATGIGYVTQDANLLPWKTVTQNIEMPLAVQGVPRKQRAEQVAHWLDLVGLTSFAKHYPAQLSGGMQKRASIARSLIYAPRFVLLDEPFGPLDAITRLVLQQELVNLWQDQADVTMIFVTHDLQEAIAMSDRVVVMSRHPGRIQGVVDIDLPRPRKIARVGEQDLFPQLHRKLWDMLRADLTIE